MEWQSYFHTDPMFKEIITYVGKWVENNFITVAEKQDIGVEINEEGMRKYAIPVCLSLFSNYRRKIQPASI
ncbi:MAG: hypothetical protein ICV51_15840 [Flavisolibacter sp.]|nr:hypothetical protein [Flavisolibacter sp.]MBD0349793.1 hypothetical protein [Flavisolibacter sp.]MBD0377085.1 hypothetical protein [Flavisolibacter sp.]